MQAQGLHRKAEPQRSERTHLSSHTPAGVVRWVSDAINTFMKTSACMLVASVFRVMMSDKVVFCTMQTSAGSSAFSK